MLVAVKLAVHDLLAVIVIVWLANSADEQPSSPVQLVNEKNGSGVAVMVGVEFGSYGLVPLWLAVPPVPAVRLGGFSWLVVALAVADHSLVSLPMIVALIR